MGRHRLPVVIAHRARAPHAQARCPSRPPRDTLDARLGLNTICHGAQGQPRQAMPPLVVMSPPAGPPGARAIPSADDAPYQRLVLWLCVTIIHVHSQPHPCGAWSSISPDQARGRTTRPCRRPSLPLCGATWRFRRTDLVPVSCSLLHALRTLRRAHRGWPRASAHTAYRFSGPSPRLPPKRERWTPAARLTTARGVYGLVRARADPRRERLCLLYLLCGRTATARTSRDARRHTNTGWSCHADGAAGHAMPESRCEHPSALAGECTSAAEVRGPLSNRRTSRLGRCPPARGSGGA